MVSSRELLAELAEAARDAARDRPGGQVERLADRPVALVPCEEAVEDLAALRRERVERLVDRERVVEGLEYVLGAELELLHGRLARLAGEPVEAQPARQLADPRPDGAVAAQRVEP